MYARSVGAEVRIGVEIWGGESHVRYGVCAKEGPERVRSSTTLPMIGPGGLLNPLALGARDATSYLQSFICNLGERNS